MASSSVAKCKKFDPNMFNKEKCGVCFRSKNEHSAAALESAKAARKVSKCGYLFIAPDINARRWQRRFFVLYNDGELTYSVDENVDTVPQGVLDMNICEDIFDAEEVSGHQFSIAVVLPEKTDYIKGSCKEEINRWFDVLIMYPRSNSTKRKRTLPATPFERVQSCSALTSSENGITKSQNLISDSCNTAPHNDNNNITNKSALSQSENQANKQDINVSSITSNKRKLLNSCSLDCTSAADNVLNVINSQSSGSSISNVRNRSKDGLNRSQSESQKSRIPLTMSRNLVKEFQPKTSAQSNATATGTYRGVRSLKHKGDSGYNDSLKKSNSFSDLRTGDSEDIQENPADLQRSWEKGLESLDDEMPRRGSRGRFSSLPCSPSLGPSIDANRQTVEAEHGFSKMLLYNPGNSKLERVRSAEGSKGGRHDRTSRSKSIDCGSVSMLTKGRESKSGGTSNISDDDELLYSKKGWLYKQNRHSQEWTKHWFVLGGYTLKYFRDSRAQEANHIEGRIDLSCCQEIKEADAKNYGFQIKTKNGLYLLSAMTSGIRTNWMQAILKSTEQCSRLSPETSLSRPTEKNRPSRRSLPTVGPKTSASDTADEARRNTVSVDWNENENIEKVERPTLRMFPVTRQISVRTNSTDSDPTDLVSCISVSNQEVSIADSLDSGINSSEATTEPNRKLFKKRSESINWPDSTIQQDFSEDLCIQENLSQSSNPEVTLDDKLYNPSPIEKKLNKLRSKNPRVRSPPPPSNTASPDVLENTEAATNNLTQTYDMVDKGSECAMLELLEVEVESLQTQLQHAQKEMISLHEDNSMLKSQLKNRSKSNEDSKKLIERCCILEEKVLKLEKESTLEQKRNKSEKSQLDLELKTATEQNALLKSQISDGNKIEASKEAKRWKRKYEEREDEITQLQQKLEENRLEARKKKKQIKDMELVMEELKIKTNEKSLENDRLKNKIKGLECQLDELSEKSFEDNQSTKDKDQEINDLHYDLETSQKDHSEMMNKYNDLSTEHRQLKDEISNRVSVSETQVNRYEQLNSQMHDLKQKYDNTAFDLAKIVEKYEKLSDEHDDTKLTLKDSLQILDSQKGANDHKDEQIESLTEVVEKKCLEYEETLNRCDDLVAEIDELNAIIESSQRELEQEKLQNFKKDAEIRQTSSTLSKKCSDYDYMLNRCEALAEELSVTKASLTSGDIESLMDALESKEDENENLQELLDTKEEDHAKLLSKYEELLVELDATKVAMSVEASKTQAEDSSDDDQKKTEEESSVEWNKLAVKPDATDPNTANVECSRENDDKRIMHSLRQKMEAAQDRSDELELQNETLVQQMQIVVEQYQDEVKSYGARIDDLAKKLQSAQLAKLSERRLQRQMASLDSQQVEADLDDVERKIEQVENNLVLQNNVTDELKVQLVSVERRVNEGELHLSEHEETPLSPKSEASFVTASEGNVTCESTCDDGPNEHHLVSRIKGLHQKVAQSNVKLKEVLNILDNDSDIEVVVLSEQGNVLNQRMSRCESQAKHLQEKMSCRDCDMMNIAVRHLSMFRYIIVNNMKILANLSDCQGRLKLLLGDVHNSTNETGFVSSDNGESCQCIQNHLESAIIHIKDTQLCSVKELDQLHSRKYYFNKVSPKGDVSEAPRLPSLLSIDQSNNVVNNIENVLDDLQSKLENEEHECKEVMKNDALDDYRNGSAEYSALRSMGMLQMYEELVKWFEEKEKITLDLHQAHEKIRNLEADRSTDDSATIYPAQSENLNNLPLSSHSAVKIPANRAENCDAVIYRQLLAESVEKEQRNNAIAKEYQGRLIDLREQQIKEFEQFNKQMQALEGYLKNVSYSEVSNASDLSIGESNGKSLSQSHYENLAVRGACLSQSVIDSKLLSAGHFIEQDENWLYMQGSALAAKSMAQAELTYRISKIRDGLLHSKSVGEYLKILEQELSLALTKLQNREKLMYEVLSAFKQKKLSELASIISVSNNSSRLPNKNHSITVCKALVNDNVSEQMVLSKIHQLVLELAGFYRTLDMVGDVADVQTRLDYHVQKETEIIGEELKREIAKADDSSTRDFSNKMSFSEETITATLYNFADAIAQSAVVAAQSSYLSDIKAEFVESMEKHMAVTENDYLGAMTFPADLDYTPLNSPRGEECVSEETKDTETKSASTLKRSKSVSQQQDTKSPKNAKPSGVTRRSRRSSVECSSTPGSPVIDPCTIIDKCTCPKKDRKVDCDTRRNGTLRRSQACSEPNLAAKKSSAASRRGVSPARRSSSVAGARKLPSHPQTLPRRASTSNLEISKSNAKKPILSSSSSSPVKRPACLRPPKLPPKKPQIHSPKKNEDRIFCSFSLSHGPSSLDFLPLVTSSEC